MTIEHEVVEVDGLVVECWRRGGIEASASTLGAWLRFPKDDPEGFVTVKSRRHCGWEVEEACLGCLALRAHIRLKEQR